MRVVYLLYILSIIHTVVYGYKVLSKESLKEIAKLSKPETLDIQTGRLLKPLLVERISGTELNVQVREFIIEHFKRLNWHIELDAFSAYTPLGGKNFTNVIVTKDPEAQKRLVLAAHFDSIKKPNDRTSLEMIFFDGEEAFQKWSDMDSIYGARHLADKWEQQMLIHHHPQTVKQANRLQLIDVLVLLDLLGTPNPTFHNYFRSTSWLYTHLSNLEARLISNQLLADKSQNGITLNPTLSNGLTEMRFQGGRIGDDHIPFMQRGVNILHLIPHPFPDVWHRETDNADCLDSPTINNFDILFRAFVCEYLELDPFPHTEL
ncbi:unnamed protein product [Cunninghamella blakesleeana]